MSPILDNLHRIEVDRGPPRVYHSAEGMLWKMHFHMERLCSVHHLSDSSDTIITSYFKADCKLKAIWDVCVEVKVLFRLLLKIMVKVEYGTGAVKGRSMRMRTRETIVSR